MSTDVTSLDPCERRLQALAGGVAHELGNAMVGVIANAELLAAGLPPDSPEAAMIRDILEAGARAAALAQQMREYAANVYLELQPITVAELAREIVEAARARSSQLQIQIEDQVPPIAGDLSQLRRVLTNLVLNAEEARDGRPEEILLRVRFAPIDRGELLHDHLPASAPDKLVHIEVHDHGVGMSPETVPAIFDPFSTTKPARSGLGLAVVLGIVRAHRGGIRVQSAPGRGATFGIVFPPHEPRLVLVIDDEPLVRNGLRRILEQRGYAIIDAPDGSSGLALVDDHPEIGAVILDILMPDMSGLEVLEQIRARRPDLPVVVSSACSDVLTDVGDGFLVKPYGPRRVLELLQTLLAGPRRPR